MKKLLLTVIAVATIWPSMAQQTFNLGGDISMLPQYESVSTPYYNAAGGRVSDVLAFMGNTCTMNSMRVRLFVDPDPAIAKTGVAQDLEYVMKLGKRIKDKNMDFLLDFQYSDNWADPSNQSIPASWKKNTDNDALQDSLYNYTKRCLEYLVANGAKPDFVQIGNEVSYGMLWRNNSDRCYSNANSATWKRFTDFLSSAVKAVREVTPDAKIIIHIERAGNTDATVDFFNRMKSAGVDYDIIGLSYYPFWHGDLKQLSKTLSTLATRFPDKPVQIVETAYYYNYFPENNPSYTNTTGTWPATPAGQSAFVVDLCAELVKHDNVTGLYYWFPEENGSGGAYWSEANTVLATWINRGFWDNSTHKLNSGILKMQEFLTGKEAAGIDGVVEDGESADEDAPIYNLSGQRIGAMTVPGIYIQKGKKMLKK